MCALKNQATYVGYFHSKTTCKQCRTSIYYILCYCFCSWIKVFSFRLTFSNCAQSFYFLVLFPKQGLLSSMAMLVSFAAIIWVLTQLFSRTKDCLNPNCIPFLLFWPQQLWHLLAKCDNYVQMVEKLLDRFKSWVRMPVVIITK